MRAQLATTAIFLAFYLLNASMAVRALEVPIGFGVWPQAWNLIAWSGPLGVLAMLLFTMNIIMTIRQQPAALMQPAVSAQALQPLSTARQRSSRSSASPSPMRGSFSRMTGW